MNRQGDRYARQGGDLNLSNLADHVGAYSVPLQPWNDLIAESVPSVGRLHGKDTSVPVLATLTMASPIELN